MKFQDQALSWIIEGYTREAGREKPGAADRFDRPLGRGGYRRGQNRQGSPSTKDRVSQVLGPRKFDPELASRTSVPGVATGMAYTPVGGEILFIEATPNAGQRANHADRPDRRSDEGIRDRRVHA